MNSPLLDTAVAVGVDWGTTHRRGYALAADGRCLAEHADADGMLAARGRFALTQSQVDED